MRFEIPSPSRTFQVRLEDGAEICMRRHGNPQGARLLLSHGNGFAADAYFPYWQHLLGRFDLLVFDFRNHGWNSPAKPANHDYGQFCRDLERIIKETAAQLGHKPTAGIFHSMSARAAMKHAIEIGWRWDALVLFDPPDVPPPGHPAYEPMRAFEIRLAEWARNRRRRYASVEELAGEYRESRAARSWVAGAHELMARSVLRRSGDGEVYVLVCDPENEAAIYAQALTLNLWPRADELGGPVKLIGADPGLAGGPPTGQANQALAIEGGYDYSLVAGAGHLLQIEQPQECIRLTLAFLAQHGLA